MSQVKSFKASMLKSFKQDNDRVEPYQRGHYWDIKQNREAYKRLETAKFVSCDPTPYDIETMKDTDVYYGNNEGIALFFEITNKRFVPTENGDISIPVFVHFVKDNDDITVMDIYDYGIIGTINYLGTATLDKDGFSVTKINRYKNFEGENGDQLKNTIEWITSTAPIIAGRLAKYEVEEMADLSKSIAMRKISYQLRSTYNVFELSDKYSAQYKIDQLLLSADNTAIDEDIPTVFNQDYDVYTGPYKFIVGGIGFTELSEAKLIKYKYEGSNIDLLPDMLDELPFKNFILQCSSVDDVESDAPVTYLHCVNNVINVMANTNTYGVYINLATIDLNTWAIGTPLRVSNKHINGTQAKDWEDGMCESINEWINAYTEFMLKFTRLMPYSENVNNNSHEIHTTNVVNNTSVYKIVVLNPDQKKRSSSGHKGGTHASPREHTRIAHKRTYKSGKIVYFPEVVVNEGHLGKVHKEYDATNLR